MRKARVTFFNPLLGIILALAGTYASEFPLRKASEARLIWPQDRLGKLWEGYANQKDSIHFLSVWPKSVGEICQAAEMIPSTDPDQSGGFLPLVLQECFEKTSFYPISAT